MNSAAISCVFTNESATYDLPYDSWIPRPLEKERRLETELRNENMIATLETYNLINH
jgi:hypothetical protein